MDNPRKVRAKAKAKVWKKEYPSGIDRSNNTGILNITTSLNTLETRPIKNNNHENKPHYTINVTKIHIKIKKENIRKKINEKTQITNTDSNNGVHIEGVANHNTIT